MPLSVVTCTDDRGGQTDQQLRNEKWSTQKSTSWDPTICHPSSQQQHDREEQTKQVEQSNPGDRSRLETRIPLCSLHATCLVQRLCRRGTSRVRGLRLSRLRWSRLGACLRGVGLQHTGDQDCGLAGGLLVRVKLMIPTMIRMGAKIIATELPEDPALSKEMRCPDLIA